MPVHSSVWKWLPGLVCSLLLSAGARAEDTAQDHAGRARQAISQGDAGAAERELREAVRLSPLEPEYLALLGVALGMQQKLQESDSYLNKALELDPSDAASRRNLGWNQFQLGELRQAKANLERVLNQHPGDGQATLVLGMVEEELKDYRSAIRLLESVPGPARERLESMAALARAYHFTGRREKAREILQSLERHPAGAQGVFLGGQVAAELGDFPTAESLFRSIHKTYPDAAKLAYNLAFAQYRSGKFPEAQATLRQLIADGHESSDIYNLLAWSLYKQDNFKDAAAALDKAIALDPADESNYLDGGMMLVEHHVLEGAVNAADKALEVAPDSYRGHRLKALAEIKLGRVSDAESLYARAVSLNPSDPAAIIGLATAQLDRGDARAAEQTLKSAIARLPREATLYQAYGSMLLWSDAPNEALAVELLEKAAALDGSLPEPHYQLGKLALREDRIRDAQRELEAAVRLDSRSSKNHYGLSQVYRKLGRAADAAREVQLFQSLKSREEKVFSGVAASSAAGTPRAGPN